MSDTDETNGAYVRLKILGFYLEIGFSDPKVLEFTKGRVYTQINKRGAEPKGGYDAPA